ncbi:MAG: glycerophosphodiester phosphodiesterase family protein [Flavobacteriales bacterium]
MTDRKRMGISPVSFFLILVTLMPACSDPYAPKGDRRPPLVVAHRGASAAAPENTIPAVEKAWELGADAVEVDVRVTKDDRIVAIHDRRTGRTTGVDRAVRKLPYDRLAEMDAGSWFGAEFKGTRIPLLDSLMDHIPPDKELFIEVKSGPRTVGLLEGMLAQREVIPRFSIISFDRRVLGKAKERMPLIPTYWVRPKISSLGKLIEKAQASHLNGLNLHQKNFKDGGKVDRIRKAGLHVLSWTVNDRERARELQDMGVGSITTDKPSVIQRALD